MDVTPLLPADDASYGFDNIAGVLKISQSRLEQYLAAAGASAARRLGSPLPIAGAHRVPRRREHHISTITSKACRSARAAACSCATTSRRTADYELQIDLLCRVGGECDGSVGFADEHRLLVLVDGEQVQAFTLEPRNGAPAACRAHLARARAAEGGVSRDRCHVREAALDSRGRFGVPAVRAAVLCQRRHRAAAPHDLSAVRRRRSGSSGPFDAAGPARRRAGSGSSTCQPRAAIRRGAVRQDDPPRRSRGARTGGPSPTRTSSRCWRCTGRRPQKAGSRPASRRRSRRLLVSPDFLYRIERDPRVGAAARTIASAISSSRRGCRSSSGAAFPTTAARRCRARAAEESGRAGAAGAPDAGAIARADALVDNFAGQWLLLRNLEAHQPDLPLFPNFDDTLRAGGAPRDGAAVRQPCCARIAAVLELLTADYTFVNERLARHYGIPRSLRRRVPPRRRLPTSIGAACWATRAS